MERKGISEESRKEIVLFDTTLRDWHQCPGAAVEKDEDYFDIVRWLDQIGFDICEVWFPASSKHEEWRVNEVAKMCRNWDISTIVCWLSQMVDFQVEANLRALEPATKVNKWFFHIYFPVDPALRKASIWEKVSDSQAVENVARFSKLAKESNMIIQFSPEGYSKVWDNFDFCTDLLMAAAENGTTYFNMPDTIWWEDPDNITKEYYVKTIWRHKAILDEAFPWNNFVWSVHNHNDLWNAVQNSVNGVKEWTWINKIEWTINGIGERAGNADLNQVITRMKTTLASKFNIDHIDASHLQRVSELVAWLMLPVQPNYPIVGSNASKHTSWGHTNAVIKNPLVYQPFDPKITGGEVSMTYWPNSWGNLAIEIIEKNWYTCPKSDKRDLDEFLKRRMATSWRYKWFTDEELLVEYIHYRNPIRIGGISQDGLGENKTYILKWKVFWEKNLKIKWNEVPTELIKFISEKLNKEFDQNFELVSIKSESNTLDGSLIHNSTVTIRDKDNQEYSLTKSWEDPEMSSIRAIASIMNRIYINLKYKREETK